MPVRHGVGISEATPSKQELLRSTMGSLLGAACAVACKRGVPAYVADMNAGPGINKDTHEIGSPLIIAAHVQALRARGYDLRMVCAECNRDHLLHLKANLRLRYPDVPVTFHRSQGAALDAIPGNAFGVTYWDPNGYCKLDTDLLAEFGRTHPTMDVLMTRACLAGLRCMRAEHVKNALRIQDYLALTGKRKAYIWPYAHHDWWTFAFASNYVNRDPKKLGPLIDITSPQGQRLLRTFVEGGSLKTAMREAGIVRARASHVLIQEQFGW